MRIPLPRLSVLLLSASLALAACGDDPLLSGGDAGISKDTLGDLPTSKDLPVADTGFDIPTVDPDTLGPQTCDDDPMPFGCPCEFNTQCDSGYCIAVEDDTVDQRCTRTCTDECPEGWDCKPIQTPGDPITICVQKIDTLCRECFVDADCQVAGDKCLDFPDGKFCGQACATEACPTGYTCQDAGGSQQCMPDSGSCTCPPEVDLMTDPDNCGVCNKVCEFDHALPECVEGKCGIGSCDNTWWNLDQQPGNGCEYECEKTSVDDEPDSGGVDADCDGIDGQIARAVFVAPYGKSNAAGTKDDPLSTITKGIAKAEAAADKDHVYVAAGTYEEQVEMVSGVSVFGGYSADGIWKRSLALYETIIQVEPVDETGAVRAVLFDGVDGEATLAGFTIKAGNNPDLSGSSYGIWMRDTGGAALVTDCRIIGGNGGPGESAVNLPKAADGVTGNPGKSTIDTDCFCDEFDTYGGKGGKGAVSSCDAGKGAGGDGADSGCGDDDGKAGKASPDGVAGGGIEEDGDDGGNGVKGVNGLGGLKAGSVSADGLWIGEAGGDGTNGTPGKGGGGGGSGDGHPNGLIGCAIWGGGGGGGGSGGCGGKGALGGGAGGGSFAVFLVDSSPELTDNEISPKSGGNGGNGGIGGAGGKGKPGGPGGTGHELAGDGGKGGDGGDGGPGGNGGGGAGGASYGVYVHGSSAPKCTGNTFLPLGTGGIGGIGGNQDGLHGQAGASGFINAPVATCAQ